MKGHRYAKPEYEVAYQDLIALARKHADKMSSAELLAVAANMLGKLLALQDQRTMSKDKASRIILANIEEGNKQAVDQLRDNTAGNA